MDKPKYSKCKIPAKDLMEVWSDHLRGTRNMTVDRLVYLFSGYCCSIYPEKIMTRVGCQDGQKWHNPIFIAYRKHDRHKYSIELVILVGFHWYLIYFNLVIGVIIIIINK